MIASLKRPSVLLAAALLAATAGAASARSIKAGLLTCNVSSGTGFVVFQDQSLSCVFRNKAGGPPDRYTGSFRTYGVALGGVAQGRLGWAVFSAIGGVPRGALAGEFAGVGGQATVGGGLGANVLVGGSNRAFSLQPLSMSAQTGLNVAGGITAVTLVPAP
jgi:hypothetical protein